MESFFKEIERQQQMIEADPAMRNLAFGLQMLFIILGAIAAIWIANDAKKNGMSSFGWGSFVFMMWVFFGIIGGPIAMAIYFWRKKAKRSAIAANSAPSATAVPSLACSSCGRHNPADSKFCSHCGSPLRTKAPTEKTCGSCGTSNPSSNRFCTNCGKEL